MWLDNEEVKNLTERKLVICSNSTSDAQIARLEAALGKAKDDKKKAIQDAIENQKVLANLFKDQVKELIQANWTAHNTEGIEVKLLRN